jgi:hypothetical protein
VQNILSMGGTTIAADMPNVSEEQIIPRVLMFYYLMSYDQAYLQCAQQCTINGLKVVFCVYYYL